MSEKGSSSPNSEARNSLKRPSSKSKRASKVPYRQLAGMAVGLVWEFCVAVLVGFFIGQKLDEKFHTGPFLMILFVLVFLGAALFRMIKQLRHVNK